MKHPLFLLTGITALALAGAPALAQHPDHQTRQQTALADPAEKATKVVYQCPMDPEVVSAKPGKCPKCGMQLEKKTVSVKVAEASATADSVAAKQAAHKTAGCCPQKSTWAGSGCSDACKD